ncbi:alpha/beta hydrolase [Winogradskyella luteola]|uniref:Alpha/beta hydrolase n=1 Tax=Winogradskyella luteola TaxID=2828330 RepID=A0A9X1F6Y7_9FLAO|nr:alpha/beta hydrolase-fold protein [Winogradskyella luteola]MBV7268500.1 alpha/beta hydrolase [Winogradskyella luteola]
MRLKIFYILFFVFFFNTIQAQSTASKQITKFTIAAPQLDTLKTIWVYLPKDYQNSQKSYPVVYMNDAQNLFDDETSYIGEWGIDEYMDQLTEHKSIIIGIEHGNKKRLDELSPYTNEKYGGGKGDAYLTFIKNTLKPHVDVTYRTKPKAEHTTIFGASLGGLISFYATIKYPDTFGKAGVFSASFWFSENIYDLVKTTEIPKSSRFYFLVGSDEGESMVPDHQRMVELLKSKGVNAEHIENHIIEGGKHNEALWKSHFPNAYQWLTYNNTQLITND